MADFEWNTAVNNLRQKASEFNTAYQLLLNSENIASSNDDLYSEYDSLRYKGDLIKSTIQRATALVDEAYATTNSIIGKDNTINMIKNASYTDGLGFLPLIPIAFISSAIAAITYWINDTVKYLSKVEQVKNLIDKDIPPDDAYSIVQGQFFSYKKYIPWIIGGTVALFAVPKLIKLVRN